MCIRDRSSSKDLIVGTDIGEWVLNDRDSSNPVPIIKEQSRWGSSVAQGIHQLRVSDGAVVAGVLVARLVLELFPDEDVLFVPVSYTHLSFSTHSPMSVPTIKSLSLIHIFTSNGTNQLALPPPKSSSLLAAK